MHRYAISITIILLIMGGVLRLAVALQGDPMLAYFTGGGDTAWYLANSEGLLSGQVSGTSLAGVPYMMSMIPIPPLYLLFLGLWQKITTPEAAIIGIRISQVLMSLLTGALVADVVRRLTHSPRAALLVLGIMMIDPAQILEPNNINTETLYITLLVLGVWAYVTRLADVQAPRRRDALLVGVVIGLATLTRAVSILFPVVLVMHLMWCGRHSLRRWLPMAAVLLIAYTATISTWTIYNLITYDRLVIVSTQMMPAIWRGAITEDGSPQQNDALLLAGREPDETCTENCTAVPTQVYVEQTASSIFNDPLGYVRLRITELTESILQPHATTNLPGESLRVLLMDWIRSGFTLAGLQRLVDGDYFWLKLVIYLFQYAAYGLTMVGLWRLRGSLWLTGAPLGFILYTIGIHVVLLALPRYIFPIMPFCWMLAGAAFMRWQRSPVESPPAHVPAQRV